MKITKGPKPKLLAAQAAHIASLLNVGVPQRDIAAMFGVTQSTVCRFMLLHLQRTYVIKK